MSRRFIATVLAGGLALTSLTAAPARALSDEQLMGLLVGSAVIFAITNSRKDDRYRPQTYNQPNRGYYPRDGYRPPRYNQPRVNQRKILPADCLRRHKTRNGQVRLMGKRCLQNNYRHVNRLPQQCRSRVNTVKGWRQGYDPRCLRRNGYKLANR